MDASTSGPEQRQYSRVDLPLPVRLRCGSVVIGAEQALNVSAAGIAIETDEDIAAGTTCTVEILLGDRMVITAQAVVVRQFGDKLAARITDIEPASYELLKSLVSYHAEDSERAEREFSAVFDSTVGL